MRTVDHDPNELPHRVIKLITIGSTLLLILLMVPISMGIRWLVGEMSLTVEVAIFFLMIGGSSGFFFGRADAFHEMFPDRETRLQQVRKNFVPIVKYCGWLALRWPFAIFILPVKSWKHARRDGSGKIASLFHAFSGMVFGLCLTLLFVAPVGALIEIALGI